jgi:HlyD family secretion protein
MKFISVVLIIVAITTTACTDDQPASDAYGHFESREVVVSAEHQGIVRHFIINEGDYVEAGTLVGWIDTLSLDIQRKQVLAQVETIKAKRTTARAQTAIVEEELNTVDYEIRRYENLVTKDAVPLKLLDDLHAKKRILTRQKDLQKAQEGSIQAEMDALSTQLLSIEDQIRKCRIINPITGKVLHTHIEQFEMTIPGKPLFTIANLDTLDLRIYVTGDQLSSIRLGMDVEILYDAGNKSIATARGMISRIATQAEFTPKFLQTRQERVSMVYAVMVQVPNNGALQIGMPAEVRFELK